MLPASGRAGGSSPRSKKGRLLSRRKKQKPSRRVDDTGNTKVAASNVKHQPQPVGWRLDALVRLLFLRAVFEFFDLIQNYP
jgi:hypothetical protein